MPPCRVQQSRITVEWDFSFRSRTVRSPTFFWFTFLSPNDAVFPAVPLCRSRFSCSFSSRCAVPPLSRLSSQYNRFYVRGCLSSLNYDGWRLGSELCIGAFFRTCTVALRSSALFSRQPPFFLLSPWSFFFLCPLP